MTVGASRVTLDPGKSQIVSFMVIVPNSPAPLSYGLGGIPVGLLIGGGVAALLLGGFGASLLFAPGLRARLLFRKR